MGVLGVVIQARIWAKRFPAKVLADLGGETILEHLIRRCKQIRGVDHIIVATPDLSLTPIIRTYGARPYLGDNENVLRRYIQACEAFKLDAAIRLTADCPFIDPWVVAELIDLWNSGKYDYVSNVLERTYPYGLDTEIVSLEALRRIAKKTNEQKYLEHVTLYIREHLDEFETAGIKADQDYTNYDWRVDFPEDLPYLRLLYKYTANTLSTFSDIIRMHFRYAQRIRVSTCSGGEPGGNPSANDGHAAAADCSSHPEGYAWYERRHSHKAAGS